jgi:hypothetical protein
MARRYKLYAAESGKSCQYFFVSSRRVNRPECQGPGSDYVFVVMADAETPFTLCLFVSDRALAAWRLVYGRELGSAEMYAAAKMRLFRALDELSCSRPEWLNLLVGETNIESLLAPPDL